EAPSRVFSERLIVDIIIVGLILINATQRWHPTGGRRSPPISPRPFPSVQLTTTPRPPPTKAASYRIHHKNHAHPTHRPLPPSDHRRRGRALRPPSAGTVARGAGARLLLAPQGGRKCARLVCRDAAGARAHLAACL